MSTPQKTDSDEALAAAGQTVLAVLRRHGIGAFNGSQVACAHCRLWMKTDEYHQHVAQIAERWLITPSVKRTCRTCHAGLDTATHHEMCIAPLDQLDGGA